jgi:hypothetical protein
VAASGCVGFAGEPELCDKAELLCTVNEIRRDGAFGGWHICRKRFNPVGRYPEVS